MCRSQVRVNSLIIDLITLHCIVSIVLMNYCFISGYIVYDIMHTVEALINRHRGVRTRLLLRIFLVCGHWKCKGQMAAFRSFPIYIQIYTENAIRGKKCLFVFSFTVLACVQTSPPTSETVSLFSRARFFERWLSLNQD